MSERNPLDTFDTGRVPVNTPLSPRDVRRLGERRRARQRAVTATAAVAAIAAGVGGVAIGVRGGDDRQGQVATHTPSATDSNVAPDVVTTIPDDFPLTQGWGDAPTEAVDPLTLDGGWQITACSLDLPEANTSDRRGVANADYSQVRQLLTFSSESLARRWIGELDERARTCAPDRDQAGVRRGTKVVRIDPVGDGSMPSVNVWWTTEEGGEAGPGDQILQATARGNAVLLAWHSHQGRWQAPFDDEFERAYETGYAATEGVLEAMCVFSGDCESNPG